MEGRPQWSVILRGLVGEWPSQTCLREIADCLESETTFFMVPSKQTPNKWKVPTGWIYSKNDFPRDFEISAADDFIKWGVSNEAMLLDQTTGDIIPEALAECGVKSVITARVEYHQKHALLVVCNSEKVVGKPPFQVAYTRADVELAVVIARAVSFDGVRKIILEEGEEVAPVVSDVTSREVWGRERKQLLKTHRSWFVAYQDGTRVALERSLDHLVYALEKKLGKPRRACEFYEIVEHPAHRRGPSPRTKRPESRR